MSSRQKEAVGFVKDNCKPASNWMSQKEIEIAKDMLDSPKIPQSSVEAFAEIESNTISRIHQSETKQLCWSRFMEILWWTKETAPEFIYDAAVNLFYEGTQEL